MRNFRKFLVNRTPIQNFNQVRLLGGFTNLKFIVDSVNIDLFFEIVKMYVKKQVNLEIMSRNLDILLTTITVNGIEQVDSIQNGLYTITDPAKISPGLKV